MNPNFNEFKNSYESVPTTLYQKTFNHCKEYLFEPFRFWLKTFFSFLIGITISLLLCPQYGLSQLAMTQELHHLWMRYGERTCALICGGFFMFFASLILWFAMNRAEKKYLSTHSWLLTLVLCAFSMGSFWMIDPAVIELEFAIFWCIGFIIYFKSSLLWLGKSYKYQQA